MKAIILAAGRGSRMKKLTDDRPKCLNTLLGKPLLHWQLDALSQGGVEDVLVVRGYRKEMLTGAFQTAENPRWMDTNMVETLRCAGHWLEQDACIISYSDIVYKSAHVTALAKATSDIAITYDTRWEPLWQLRFEDPLSDAETFREEGGILQEIGARANDISDIHGQYMGLIRVTPQGWSRIGAILDELGQAAVDKLDMTALLNLLLERGIEIGAVPVAGGWCEADSGDDLEKYEAAIAQSNNQPWSHDWR